ncbi:hypothetical protein Anas_01267 [Armadillidium nasatum]|uniref:Uncharacterized protein n=1 Tax=Armadillidium nasatum TaxID=96803 RepID=A0A5N5TKT8_9CRUS|nr:hypothetical protein Anas_01267 [Armadillidium nasatum]
MNIHKFISITRPLARTLTPGKIFCMIIAAWAWALLYNLTSVGMDRNRETDRDKQRFREQRKRIR